MELLEQPSRVNVDIQLGIYQKQEHCKIIDKTLSCETQLNSNSIGEQFLITHRKINIVVNHNALYKP